MATARQQRAITKTLEKLGKKQPIKMGEIMLESGYSKAMAKNPQILTTSKAWEETMKGVNWGKQLKQVEDLADTELNKDKDNNLKAKDMLFKLGDKYPQKNNVSVNLFQKIDNLFSE
jgi:hypothetical protein